MDQVEAVANLLIACAAMLRRESAAGLPVTEAILEAIGEMDALASRLLESVRTTQQDHIGPARFDS